MQNPKSPRSDFGLARIKQEGTPAHPEDIMEHCGCAKCEEVWQRQLKAYNDFHGITDGE